MKANIIVICIFLFCFSCRKNDIKDVQFPLETQNGLNTFGCFIDGVPFVPSTTLFGNVRPINVFYRVDSTQYNKGGFLSIQGTDARYNLDFAGNIVIQKLNVFGPGEYPLIHISNCSQPYDCDAGGYTNALQSRTYFIEGGKLTISKLDTINKIISGRFYFTSKDTLGNKKEVTNGVFDTKYIN